MARRVRGDHGGILGLCELIDQHKEAIEYDLIGLGLRLDWLPSPALSWRDLSVIVQHSPRTSALNRALLGEHADWGVIEHLAAGQFDALQRLAWLQSEDGAKGRNRPKPLERPGVKPDADSQIGSSSIPLDEMADLMARRNPNQHH